MADPDLSAETVARLRAAGCVYAEEEAELLLDAPGHLEALVARRVAGEPLEWVLGWVDFGPVRLGIRPGVFVPRRRTELLAAQAIARLRPGGTLVDLCCGSGAIAAAVATEVPLVDVYAVDIDPVAVECARENLPTATVLEGDLVEALPGHLRGAVDVLVANTPYVPTEEVALMPPEARDHEPRATLDGGPDGLALLRRISAVATEWLAPGGHLLIEVSERQRPTALATFEGDGLLASASVDEELGATVAIGRTRA